MDGLFHDAFNAEFEALPLAVKEALIAKANKRFTAHLESLKEA